MYPFKIFFSTVYDLTNLSHFFLSFYLKKSRLYERRKSVQKIYIQISHDSLFWLNSKGYNFIHSLVLLMLIMKIIPYSKLFFYSTIDSDLIIFEFACLSSEWKKIQQSYQMCQEKKVSRKGDNKLLQPKTTKIFF